MLTRAGVVVVIVMALLAPSQALADDAPPPGPTVTWGGNVAGEIGEKRTPVATVTVPPGTAPHGFVVVVEQGSDATWRELQRATTEKVSQPVLLRPGTTHLRARLLVEDHEVSSATIDLTGSPVRVTTTFAMASSGKDYQRTPFKVATRRTRDGRAVDLRVQVQGRRAGSSTWRSLRTVRTGPDGVARSSLLLRHDYSVRAVSLAVPRLRSGASTTRHFDNRPPGTPVVLPKGASRPRLTLPAQPRARRAAADATISPISDAVWRSMKGRTWRAGCPVGRSGLRVVRVSYWAFDGYVRRGEIVVRTPVARRTARVFSDLFRAKAPIRSMYRVDRFGYNADLRGGNDYRSMAADNTSGFNCRHVVGQPGTLSPHSYGGSIDVNPWENPFRSRIGYKPNASWATRTRPVRVTYRSSNHTVVKIFRKHGFRWLGSADLQHFQD